MKNNYEYENPEINRLLVLLDETNEKMDSIINKINILKESSDMMLESGYSVTGIDNLIKSKENQVKELSDEAHHIYSQIYDIRDKCEHDYKEYKINSVTKTSVCKKCGEMIFTRIYKKCT